VKLAVPRIGLDFGVFGFFPVCRKLGAMLPSSPNEVSDLSEIW
jgi:hypothetical protein